MHFVIIYVWEAHPIEGRPGSYTYDEDGSPINQPTKYEERVEMARRTIAAENISVTVMVDEMDNALMCTYGPAPNNAYLIGIDGRIVFKQGWYQPDRMEEAVREVVNL